MNFNINLSFGLKLILFVVAFLFGILVVNNFEWPPMLVKQQGFRGLGMIDVQNPRILAKKLEANKVPEPIPAIPAGAGGPPATTVYKNVQVLTDLSVGDFTRLMVAITSWVAPQKGCTYCHAEGKELSDDSLYTKQVARRMLQMTRHVNGGWKDHVAETGVTCYTCHHGQPIPKNYWTADPGPKAVQGMAGWRDGQNIGAPSVGYTSLPFDPFTAFLSGKEQIRVISKEALPTRTNPADIKDAEWTYGLMMHISDALGQNCTFCHNSRSFASWEGPPQRARAWYGIRMVRDLNNNYLDPLAPKYPADRLGVLGDAPKANCATCHNGLNKPLAGVSMLKDYPALAGPSTAKAALGPPTPAPVVIGELVVVYFDVDSTALHNEAPKTLEVIVAKLKANPSAKATISGYHSATGDMARNHELAKGRAVAVLAAMKDAGISENRVTLQKPIAEKANVAGEEPKARRVEVKLQ